MNEDQKSALSADAEDLQAIWDEVDEDQPSSPKAEQEEAEPEPASEDDGEEEANPEPPAQGRSDEDPDLSGLDPSIRAYFEKREQELQLQVRRQTGAQSGLERKLNALKEEYEAYRQKHPEPASDDDDDGFEEDFPEINAKLAKTTGALEKRIAAFEEKEREQEMQRLVANREKWAKSLPSPDFLKTHAHDFLSWIESDATAADLRAYEANKEIVVDPDAAIRVTNNFAKFLEARSAPSGATQKPDRRQRQLESAKSAPQTSRAASLKEDAGNRSERQRIWDEIEVD